MKNCSCFQTGRSVINIVEHKEITLSSLVASLPSDNSKWAITEIMVQQEKELWAQIPYDDVLSQPNKQTTQTRQSALLSFIQMTHELFHQILLYLPVIYCSGL